MLVNAHHQAARSDCTEYSHPSGHLNAELLSDLLFYSTAYRCFISALGSKYISFTEQCVCGYNHMSVMEMCSHPLRLLNTDFIPA